MSDIFISYARPDEPIAERVADALRAEGHLVWRDDDLPAHRAYADVIEERLGAAKAVVVLWSAEAVKSQWVRAEADSARSAGILIQASIDGSVPPLPFNQIHCANLHGHDGPAEAPGWRKLAASVAELAGTPSRVANGADRRSRRRPVSICVLPFVNMSGDSDQEYFSDGISEDITTDLSKVSALSVIARNTAFSFKGRSIDVAEVARKLGVSHVLEGSVRKVGSRVRITAQLIDGDSGDHIWADRYDRDLDDIFAIQDEISKAIVDALKLNLLPEERKAIEQRGTTCAEAYNLYLLGRQYWVTGNHGDRRREERVMRICGKAVEVDPQYARAWALLGMAQSNLRYGFGCEVDDGFAAANAALSIDPCVAEAHCAISRRLEEQRRSDEAWAEIEKALRIDPDSWEVNKEAGRLCRERRRIADAAFHYAKAAAVMESDFHAWGMLVTCHIALGDRAAAGHAASMTVAQADKALAQDPSNGAALGTSAAALVVLGERERANERIERALLVDPDNLNMRYNFACALALAQDREAALAMLGPVLQRSSRAMLPTLDTDPDLDSLRDDPRFQAMVEGARKRLGVIGGAADSACGRP